MMKLINLSDSLLHKHILIIHQKMKLNADNVTNVLKLKLTLILLNSFSCRNYVVLGKLIILKFLLTLHGFFTLFVLISMKQWKSLGMRKIMTKSNRLDCKSFKPVNFKLQFKICFTNICIYTITISRENLDSMIKTSKNPF